MKCFLSTAMSETETLKVKRQRKYNRDFQKNEVIRYLVKKEPLMFKEEPLQIGNSLTSLFFRH
jgi:hypothetical protein